MESEYATTTSGRQIIVNGDGTWVSSGEPNASVREAPAPSAATNNAPFRKSNWGDSPDAVARSEGRDPDDTADGVLGYETKLAGLEVLCIFTFVGERLVRGRYSVTEPHSDDNAFLRDFESLAELLGKKYGPPSKSETIWHNDLYQDEPSEWGMAVSSGHLVRWHEWSTQDTKITLLLSGDDYEVNLVIDYMSTELGHLEAEANEADALGDL